MLSVVKSGFIGIRYMHESEPANEAGRKALAAWQAAIQQSIFQFDPDFTHSIALYLGKRKCESYDKNTLRQYARVLGINVNENMSKKELCLRLGGPKKLPANLQRNIKAGKVVLKKRKRTPTPSPPKNKGGPSKPVKRWGNTPSPSPNNENFANILEFARKLNKA